MLNRIIELIRKRYDAEVGGVDITLKELGFDTYHKTSEELAEELLAAIDFEKLPEQLDAEFLEEYGQNAAVVLDNYRLEIYFTGNEQRYELAREIATDITAHFKNPETAGLTMREVYDLKFVLTEELSEWLQEDVVDFLNFAGMRIPEFNLYYSPNDGKIVVKAWRE